MVGKVKYFIMLASQYFCIYIINREIKPYVFTKYNKSFDFFENVKQNVIVVNCLQLAGYDNVGGPTADDIIAEAEGSRWSPSVFLQDETPNTSGLAPTPSYATTDMISPVAVVSSNPSGLGLGNVIGKPSDILAMQISERRPAKTSKYVAAYLLAQKKIFSQNNSGKT